MPENPDAFMIRMWVCKVNSEQAEKLLSVFSEIASLYTVDFVGSMEPAEDAQEYADA